MPTSDAARTPIRSVNQEPDVTLDKRPARDAPVHVDPDLGVMRTKMAADRTLMA
jgi:hypothetical protein